MRRQLDPAAETPDPSRAPRCPLGQSPRIRWTVLAMEEEGVYVVPPPPSGRGRLSPPACMGTMFSGIAGNQGSAPVLITLPGAARNWHGWVGCCRSEARMKRTRAQVGTRPQVQPADGRPVWGTVPAPMPAGPAPRKRNIHASYHPVRRPAACRPRFLPRRPRWPGNPGRPALRSTSASAATAGDRAGLRCIDFDIRFRYRIVLQACCNTYRDQAGSEGMRRDNRWRASQRADYRIA